MHTVSVPTERNSILNHKINIPVKCLILFIKFIDALRRNITLYRTVEIHFQDGQSLSNTVQQIKYRDQRRIKMPEQWPFKKFTH